MPFEGGNKEICEGEGKKIREFVTIIEVTSGMTEKEVSRIRYLSTPYVNEGNRSRALFVDTEIMELIGKPNKNIRKGLSDQTQGPYSPQMEFSAQGWEMDGDLVIKAREG